MPASSLPGGEGALLRLPSAPHRADNPSAIHHPLSTSLAPGWPIAANPASALWRLFTICSPLAHRELEQMCFEIHTALYLRLRQQASVITPAWYQWATLPAAAMRPTSIASVQYFLCDRKVVTLRMDDTIPATPMQTSTIVPPVRTVHWMYPKSQRDLIHEYYAASKWRLPRKV